jgi:hypothetical protein
LTSAGGGAAPARCTDPTGGLVAISTLLTNGGDGFTVTLMGDHKFEDAVPILMMVPIDKDTVIVSGLIKSIIIIVYMSVVSLLPVAMMSLQMA